MNREFEKLQDRMVEQAIIYKDTKFDPFYRFIIGELDWNECCKQVEENLIK